LITAPLYGRWHALTQRLLYNQDGSAAPNSQNWVHELNLDPRFRVAAGFGADIVEANRDAYMDDAWEQIGDVLAANNHIRRLQLAKEVAWRWYGRHLTTLAAVNPERALLLTAPVSTRVLTSGSTVQYLRTTSLLTPAYTSAAMRRVVRPGARLVTSLPFDATETPQNLLERVNAGEVSVAPPKVVPPGVPTVNQVAQAIAPSGVPAGVLDLLNRYPWLPVAVLVIGLLIAVVAGVLLALISLPLGILAAAHRGSALARVAIGLAALGQFEEHLLGKVQFLLDAVLGPRIRYA